MFTGRNGRLTNTGLWVSTTNAGGLRTDRMKANPRCDGPGACEGDVGDDDDVYQLMQARAHAHMMNRRAHGGGREIVWTGGGRRASKLARLLW